MKHRYMGCTPYQTRLDKQGAKAQMQTLRNAELGVQRHSKHSSVTAALHEQENVQRKRGKAMGWGKPRRATGERAGGRWQGIHSRSESQETVILQVSCITAVHTTCLLSEDTGHLVCRQLNSSPCLRHLTKMQDKSCGCSMRNRSISSQKGGHVRNRQKQKHVIIASHLEVAHDVGVLEAG